MNSIARVSVILTDFLARAEALPPLVEKVVFWDLVVEARGLVQLDPRLFEETFWCQRNLLDQWPYPRAWDAYSFLRAFISASTQVPGVELSEGAEIRFVTHREWSWRDLDDFETSCISNYIGWCHYPLAHPVVPYVDLDEYWISIHGDDLDISQSWSELFPSDIQSQGIGFGIGVSTESQDFLTTQVNSLKEAFDKVSDKFDAATAARSTEVREALMKTMEDQRNLVAETLKSVEGKTASGWEKVKADLFQILWYVPLVSGVLGLLTLVRIDRIMRDMLVSVLKLILPAVMWERIKKYFYGDVWEAAQCIPREYHGGIESQGPAGPAFFNDLGNVIAAVFTCVSFKDGAHFVDFDSIQKRMTFFERASGGWEAFTGFVVRCFERCYNWVSEYFGGDAVQLTKSGHEQVEEFTVRVMTLKEYLRLGKAPDIAFARRVVETNHAGQVLDVKCRYRMTPVALRAFTDALKALDDINKRCAPALSEVQTTRTEPVAVMFNSEPGVGKSLIAPLALQYVLERVMTVEDQERIDKEFRREIYCKADSEYWEGYHGQKALVIDDFAQKVRLPGADADDFMELIRCVNTWKYSLNMAFAEKGLNYFSSSLVWCTTNVDNMRTRAHEMLSDPAAFRRRFAFYERLVVSEEYCLKTVTEILPNATPVETSTRRLDYPKWEAACTKAGHIIWKAWQVVPCDWVNGAVLGGARDLDVFLDEVVREYKRRYVGNTDIASMLAKDGKFTTIVSQGPEIEPFEDAVEDSTVAPATPEGYSNPFLDEPASASVMAPDPWYSQMAASFPTTFQEKLKAFQNGFAAHFASFRAWLAANPFLVMCVKYAGLLGLCCLALKAVVGGFQMLLQKWSKPPKVLTKEQMSMLAAMRPEDREVVLMMAEAYKAKPFSPDFSDEEVAGWANELRTKNGVRMKICALSRVQAESGHREPNRNMLGITPQPGVKPQSVDVEVSCDQQSSDISKKLSKNTWQVSITLGGDEFEMKLGHAMAIRDRIFLMPYHYITVISRLMREGKTAGDGKIVFRNLVNPALSQPYLLSRFLTCEMVPEVDHDYVLVRIPWMNMPCDVVRHFVRASDIVTGDHVDVRVECSGGLRSITEHPVPVIKFAKGRLYDYMAYNDPNSGTMIHMRGYASYRADTTNGDCGAAVFLANKPSTEGRKILGMHVAGSPKELTGYACLLTQERLEASLAKFKQTVVTQSLDWEGLTFDREAPDFGSVTHVADVEEGYSTTSKSALFRSPLHNGWGASSQLPARLGPFTDKDGIRVDPQGLATAVYGGPPLVCDERKVTRASYAAFYPFFEASPDDSREVLSFEVACAGIAGEPYMSGLKRSKSPGYPYNVRGHKNKTAFFGKEGEFDFSSPECAKLRQEVEAIVTDASQGVRNMHIYTDFLKDELRGVEKVAIGKTRLISGAPLPYVIAFRMYFTPWLVAVQKHGLRSGVAVGINPYTDWATLARHLSSKGPCCFAGDYKSFDANAKPQIQDGILERINAWFALVDPDPVKKLIRTVLWQEVSFSRHLGGVGQPRTAVYQWFGALPSGHPATSIINSFYNLILFALCWEDTMGVALTHRFWDYVYVCTYGDDNVVNVSPEVVTRFNQNTVAQCMLAYGQTYTPEDKSTGKQMDYRSLEEISFLKRAFRKEDGMWFAPKELSSTLYTPYWLSSKRGSETIVRNTLEDTFLELSLHTQEVWDHWFPLMSKVAWERLEYNPKLACRADYLDFISRAEYRW